MSRQLIYLKALSVSAGIGLSLNQNDFSANIGGSADNFIDYAKSLFANTLELAPLIVPIKELSFLDDSVKKTIEYGIGLGRFIVKKYNINKFEYLHFKQYYDFRDKPVEIIMDNISISFYEKDTLIEIKKKD